MLPETEPKPTERHLLIGLLGPLGAGKSTLAQALSAEWGKRDLSIAVMEEQFLGNPHLAGFYEDPGQFSFDSEIRFVTDAALQLSDLSKTNKLVGSCVAIDPAYEMHGIYPEAHFEMGWLNQDQIDVYRRTYLELKDALAIPTPDIFVVVNAPVKVLLERIKQRASTRPYEQNILDKPWGEEYVTRLANAVDRWYNRNLVLPEHPPIIREDSGIFNFSPEGDGRDSVIEDIGNWIRYHFVDKQTPATGGTNLIVPGEIYRVGALE